MCYGTMLLNAVTKQNDDDAAFDLFLDRIESEVTDPAMRMFWAAPKNPAFSFDSLNYAEQNSFMDLVAGKNFNEARAIFKAACIRVAVENRIADLQDA